MSNEEKARRIFALVATHTMPIDQLGFYTEEMMYNDILEVLNG